MSTLSSYYLIGPIKVNSTFILTYNRDNIAYFLTLVKGENGKPDDLIFDPRAKGDSNTLSDPLVMRVVSSGTNKFGITYADSSEVLRYITGIKVGDKNFAGASSKPETLIFSQTEVAPWPSVPFLAGVQYEFKNVSNQNILWKTYVAEEGRNGVASSIKMSMMKPVIESISGGIRAVPTNWFVRGTCDTNTEITAVVNNEILWVAREAGEFMDGFTDLSDCRVGVKYSYCPPGKDCSVSCKGPCPDSNQSDLGCFFDSKIKGFKCEENPVDEPWWRQTWFILGAVAVGTIVVILIIFLIVVFSLRGRLRT